MKPRYIFTALVVVIVLLLVWGNVQDWQKISNPPAGDTAAMAPIIDTNNSYSNDYQGKKDIDSSK